MKSCIISLAAGLIVGLAYGVLGVRSPAPPIVALVGLLGMLLGEQMAPVAKRALAGGGADPFVAAASDSQKEPTRGRD